ncbi:MAG TPA: NADPH-dependent F420 reductase [Phototrophicaceae bacterium]|nr:NADPH-dependent F420 reductase [Phototrophicaceae bacterium]
MNIAVIGTGKMGSGLGRLWAHKGHAVVFGSRDPYKAVKLAETIGIMAAGATVDKAVRFANVVLLAVPWAAARDSLYHAGALEGKIIIDCTNPTSADCLHLLIGHETSGAEQIAAWTPGARIVKAFNYIYAQIIHSSPKFGSQTATVLYCGDDGDAKETVAGLIADAGFDPVDAGSLQNARYLEPIAEQMIHLAYVMNIGTDQAIKIIRR